MFDFSIGTYLTLIKTLMDQGFSFLTFSDFLAGASGKIIMLRHDVDKDPVNSLVFAKIQSEMGIKGTYYFRAVPGSWDENIMRKITGIGHEIGYHYEDLSFAWAKLKASGVRRQAQGEKYEKELMEIGIDSFSRNLERLRKIASVKTICMHGSPMSRWDSRLLWKYYDYHDFGIIGEPYFDLNFDEVLYLTDTGRRWDGEAVSLRDKAQGSGLRAQSENPYKDWKVKPFKYKDRYKEPSTCNPQPATFTKYNSTSDIIKAAEEGQLPDQIMMTFHPQRWTEKPLPWAKELVWQNVKNVGKYFLVRSINFEVGRKK